ncbi:MAG TPA: hypothetical protein VL422_02940 [Miltoncostaea sp.]|nr:hypothetical protein [Miltoncostaea sp.]
MTPDPPDEATTCEWCGAEYDPASRPAEPPHATARPPAATGDEPATHCEWCGAEYPDPDASPGS